MDAFASLAGQLLLAMPGIGDPRFEKAVIALCAHDESGAVGIGIGRTVPGLTTHGLFSQLNLDPGVAPDVPVYVGGPVEPQRGFVLHAADWSGEDTLHVGDRWSLTSTLDVLRAIARGEGPSRWLVALGYAGWGEGQLDEEMSRHGWFATTGNEALIFTEDAAARWKRAFAGAGVDTRLLSNVTGRA
ncbi:hypothetical protein CLG96_17800 [Sphingomonas oleivorans]|uniref:UPF0301 protein CLG96_17800 n=1 Tax=Sphingomonas oleivorans TaxID=1735121 RepID=A0A2T5FTK9_9SPHN|nr:YqgE/AlgH family protein [Sphingomonas oleivorans]PTQ07398.1 hypothetical protein CLG96_17800 [Sphingomonas oleivorans]